MFIQILTSHHSLSSPYTSSHSTAYENVCCVNRYTYTLRLRLRLFPPEHNTNMHAGNGEAVQYTKVVVKQTNNGSRLQEF